MKKFHVLEYNLRKQPFGGFKIIKVYYVGDNKSYIRRRTIYKNLDYSRAEQLIYKLESKLK